MYEINEKLDALEREGKPIGIGLIGTGQMGKDIIAQLGKMHGMRLKVAVDLDAQTAMQAFQYTDRQDEVIVTRDIVEAEKALRDGKCIATDNYKLAIQPEGVHSVIDATGSPKWARVLQWTAFFTASIS